MILHLPEYNGKYTKLSKNTEYLTCPPVTVNGKILPMIISKGGLFFEESKTENNSSGVGIVSFNCKFVDFSSSG